MVRNDGFSHATEKPNEQTAVEIHQKRSIDLEEAIFVADRNVLQMRCRKCELTKLSKLAWESN
jgi:hypothetical protein